jgi:hypothetical protein
MGSQSYSSIITTVYLMRQKGKNVMYSKVMLSQSLEAILSYRLCPAERGGVLCSLDDHARK